MSRVELVYVSVFFVPPDLFVNFSDSLYSFISV